MTDPISETTFTRLPQIVQFFQCQGSFGQSMDAPGQRQFLVGAKKQPFFNSLHDLQKFGTGIVEIPKLDAARHDKEATLKTILS